MQKTETAFTPRLWTVEEYHRMAETGILNSDERVELIAGQVIKKISPQGTPHASSIIRTDRVLGRRLGEQVLLRIQLPIRLNNNSEPEPDVAVVKVDPLDYADHHPTPPEVYLIVEVADSSLKADCEEKGKIYARSNIAEYWVLDVINRQLHVFREAGENGYQSEVILAEDAMISPLQFPDLSIAVREMLPPTL